MKINVFLFALGLCITSFGAQASGSIGIDAMIKFTDQGKGEFVVTNSADYRQFIQVAITALSVEDGQLTKMAYSRDNIDQWRLQVNPARTAIDVGMQKVFTVQYEPQSEQEREQDHAYQLTFVPTPYFTDGEPNKSTVQLAVGFAPVLIVPAENDQPLSYHMTREGGQLHIHNKGGTYLRALLDVCPDGAKGSVQEACMKTIYVLAGRELSVDLSTMFQEAEKINARLSTHRSTYRQTVTLGHGQTLTK